MPEIKQIKAWKASGLTGKPVESVEIRIDLDIGNAGFEAKSLREAFEIYFEIYEAEAQKIADALFNSLPQGTMDRLITELMGRKAAESGYRGVIK